MKYLLFGYDNHYPTGVDLIATSDDLEKIIAFAEKDNGSFNNDPFDNYEVFEWFDNAGLILVWSNNNTPPGDVVKVAFL